MKKLFSISLLVIYLFNLIGYSFYYRYCINLSDKRIVQQIDNNNYNENELIEIKVAVNLPYYNNDNHYERVDGEIAINGIHYNYVKRKIANDSIYMMCIPNFSKTQLYKDKNNYASQVNDLPTNNKENSIAKKNTLSNEYDQKIIKYIFTTPVTILQTSYSTCRCDLAQGHSIRQCQPPDLAA